MSYLGFVKLLLPYPYKEEEGGVVISFSLKSPPHIPACDTTHACPFDVDERVIPWGNQVMRNREEGNSLLKYWKVRGGQEPE